MARSRFIRFFAYGVLALFLLSCFSYLIILAERQSSRLGIIGPPLRQFANFPGLVRSVLGSKELRGVPLTFLSRADGTEQQDAPINQLDYDLFALASIYESSKAAWSFRLYNLRTDSTVHKWLYPEEAFREDDVYQFKTASPLNPLLFQDKSLTIILLQTRNLSRVDSNSNIIWKNDQFLYHHSLAFAADSSIWVCSTQPSEIRSKNGPLNYQLVNVDGRLLTWRDDQITRIDAKTGTILFNKSLSEILIENGYQGIVYGIGAEGGNDPLHLNDIQPVLEDGPYWKRDDLFLSLRNRSLVVHYRPISNEVVKLILGPFVQQHDVDIHSDHELTIFNNNYARTGTRRKVADRKPDLELRSSQVLIYDYPSDTFRKYHPNLMEEYRLFTPTAGVQTVLSNGDLFVDLRQFGRIFVLDKDEIKYRSIFPAPIRGYKHATNWIQVYEQLPF